VLASLVPGIIMGPIDASIVNVVLPTITAYFAVDISTAQWVPMIYLLIISSLLLFYGRLGDIIGYKKIYLIGIVGFVIGSAMCSVAPSIYWLIAFRAMQGIFAGMMMSVPYAIIVATFPPKERGRALGINAISMAVGLAIGPLLGGFITALWGWRFAFLINVPIGILGFICGFHIVPEFRGQPAKVDILGAVTAFIFLFFILFFVNRFQNVGINYATTTMLIIGVLSFVGFILVESRSAQPMLNLVLFKNLTFSFANLSALLNFMSQYVMVFVTPFYLQKVLKYPANKVGLVMAFFPLATMTVAPFSGYLSDKIGTKALAALGTGICAFALFLMSGLKVSSTSADVVLRLVLFGIGTGIFQSPNNSAVMGSSPKSYLGVASGILGIMRNVGMSLGIATGGIVLYSLVPAAIMKNPALSGVDALSFLTGLSRAYIVGGILAGVAVITSLVGGKRGQITT
jgi:EmrB/QacA subfamily drug resistance transporter